MLLQHFTWQQFLIAATILTAVWYALVILFFHTNRIKDLLNGKQRQTSTPERLRHAWEDDYEEEGQEDADDLTGESVLPEGMSKVSMSMFGFAPQVSTPEEPAKTADSLRLHLLHENAQQLLRNKDKCRELQQTLVPDAIEELKNIFHILQKDNGGKDQFISLFDLIKHKYASLRDTSSGKALNEFIRENALFPISNEELINLWN